MFMVTKRLYQLSGILCLLLTLSFSLYSCSEESGTEDEYADWKVWANDPSLTRIKSYTEDPTTEGDPTYYVYVKKLDLLPIRMAMCLTKALLVISVGRRRL